ncbi:class I SAM-dependent methyltransferase [Isosphaeraceae bacterium EP7]
MAYDKGQATHEFTRWSESYDRSILQILLFGPSHRALIRRLKAVHGDRPFKLLDVGCGTGIFAERVRAALPNAQVWGMDLVRGMLSKGAERWSRLSADVQPVQGDSENLPFADGSFDAVTCANSFHHYPHQDRAVAEIRRVLAPGGRMLLIDGYRDALWGWFIFDVCVAGIEGDVHHASSALMRSYCESARFGELTQTVHRGPAPFLLTEAQTPPAVPSKSVPTPHFGRTSKVAR